MFLSFFALLWALSGFHAGAIHPASMAAAASVVNPHPADTGGIVPVK